MKYSTGSANYSCQNKTSNVSEPITDVIFTQVEIVNNEKTNEKIGEELELTNEDWKKYYQKIASL